MTVTSVIVIESHLIFMEQKFQIFVCGSTFGLGLLSVASGCCIPLGMFLLKHYYKNSFLF
jgi:hypothetical protein